MKELLETMEHRARERAEAILTDAREEAERIRERGARAIERRRAEHRAQVERAAAVEAALRLADARREAAARVLAARGEALERVFDHAGRLLGEPATRAAWLERAPDWLERALAYAPPGEATVECDPATAAALGALAPPRARIEARDDAAPGIRVRGGSVEIDATLPGLLARRRSDLAIEVLGRIEDDGDG